MPTKQKVTPDKKKKVAIALQGGGSHGSFAWGVLDALLEHDDLEIIGISGTSAGAMNSAALVQGYAKNGRDGARQELGRLWRSMTEKANIFGTERSLLNIMLGSFFGMVPNPINMLNGSHSLRLAPLYELYNFLSMYCSPYMLNPFDKDPLRDFVREFYDFPLINKTEVPKIFLCATHVKSGKLKIFDGPSLKEESLLASACIPTISKAVEVDGEHYWDGGYIGNPAIYPLIYNTDAPDIIILQLRQSYRAKLPMSSNEISDRNKEITLNSCLVREMRAIYFVTELIDKGIIKDPSIRRLNMHLIRNQDITGQLDMSSALNTDPVFIEFMFKEGQKTGREWLKENFQHIGVKTTATIEKDFI